MVWFKESFVIVEVWYKLEVYFKNIWIYKKDNIYDFLVLLEEWFEEIFVMLKVGWIIVDVNLNGNFYKYLCLLRVLFG